VNRKSKLSFEHRFVGGDRAGDGLTLLLLHGTGGDESDLIPLGQTLAPGAALLSPRGRVLENGMPRFFRRLAEGIFDQHDLKVQTDALVQFTESSSQAYEIRPDRIVAVGYSNGANIASSVLLAHPKVFAAAVLFRPMVPFIPANTPNLERVNVLVAAGRSDRIVSSQETQRLVQLFENAGATVTTVWHNGGHELGQDDVDAATNWLTDWRARLLSAAG